MRHIFINIMLKIFFRFDKCWKKNYTRLNTLIITTQLADCGENVYLYPPCKIYAPHKVHFGNNVHINRGALIKGDGGVWIGNNVHIGPNLVIYSVNHNYLGNALPYDDTLLLDPVIIEDNVWIGVNVTIVPGVKIGEGAIIGAGTVVAKEVEPLSIIGSSPQRIISKRDKNHYDQMVAKGNYGGVSGKLYSQFSND